MLTFKKFTGINNVVPPERLKLSELAEATDTYVGLDGELRRRGGYTQVSENCHKNLFELGATTLCTSSGDLVAVTGGTTTVLMPALGMERVWYCALPDGRVTFANGLICGITDGVTVTSWGVPVPLSVGSHTAIPGELFAGMYQWALSYVRLADGKESGALQCDVAVPITGGILLTGLPQLDGHKLRVYVSTHDDDALYFAGDTTGSTFAYAGSNDHLTLPCKTKFLSPAPSTGTITALWRSRVLVADGSVLWASKPHSHELFDTRSDFKQFSSPITLVQPVDDGVYVGTTSELAFLSGTEFDKLVYRSVLASPTVLGSGVTVPGTRVRPPTADNPQSGTAMMCIAGRRVVAGFNGGVIGEMTAGRYETAVTEVAATFREHNGIPQYIAIPQ